MSSLRTSRTRLLGAATTVVLAALSLTACSDGTGVHAESVAASTPTAHSTSAPRTSTAGSTAANATSADPTARAATGTPKSAADAAASKAPAPADRPVTCEGSDTRTVAAPLTRPVNHMLLTVTNTGSRTCYLYSYPAVRFGEAQSVPPAIEDSKPQAVVTLQPGESGYASVSLSATDGSGTDGHTVNSLDVYFHGRSGNESVGKGAHPSLPAKGVYVDDSLKVTYWQQSMDDALNW
ncbi:MAG: DUF4232 domain-containing protein [Streptomyces sp.]|uniref:DUF4232 domain-containing protein n=1 Tax=Streptomyces sp. TaxID=1931 RepID=UPI0025F572FA|nr:DUF4232 domain-containing protein [Streptomyces sp.]MBW8798309.1 DUF4232 domain-containing protein [Streptomyces sp.]